MARFSLKVRSVPFPALSFLKRLTNTFGIVQHTKYGIPDLQHGYCLDDNARALVLVTRLAKMDRRNLETYRNLASIYLSYIHICRRDDGWMRNFISFDHRYLDERGSGDSFGRAIWAVGEAAASGPDAGIIQLADELYLHSLKQVPEMKSCRALGYALLGVTAYLEKHPHHQPSIDVARQVVAFLEQLYHRTATPDWPWFEEVLTYSNAVLPLGLLQAAAILNEPSVQSLALKTLDWLIHQTEVNQDDTLLAAPVGTDGWSRKSGIRADYDQQPVDVGLMILALGEAERQTKKSAYRPHLQIWYHWFLGKNTVGQPLASETEGYCFDGLHSDRVNQNRGSESTVMFLLAQLEMYKIERGR